MSTDSTLLKKAVELIAKIYPEAAWASCKYKDVPGVNPCSHCCDWSEIVEEIIDFSVELSLAKGDDHEYNISDGLRATINKG